MDVADELKAGSDDLGKEDFITLASRATEAYGNQEIETAVECALEAARLSRDLDLPHTEAVVGALNRTGMILMQTGYVREALTPYRRGLELAKRSASADEDVVASLHNNLGQAEHRDGNLTEARALLETSVRLREGMPRDATNLQLLGFALDNLGAVCSELGDFDAAETVHRRALTLFEDNGGPIDAHVATALGNLSNLYWRRKDLEHAVAYRLRALDTHDRLLGPEHRETLNDLRALALLDRETGDLARSDETIHWLLSIGGEAPGAKHRTRANVLLHLAERTFDEFALDLAERLATRAADLLDGIEGPRGLDALKARHLLANIARATGHLDPAEQHFTQALRGYEALGRHKEAARVQIDLFKIYRERRAFPLAQKMLDSAIERLKQFPEVDSQQMASALGNLAQLYSDLGEHERSDRTYGEALACIEGDARSPERAWLLHNRGQLQYHIGRHREGLALYEQAKALWMETHGRDHPHVATTTANLALLYWATGDTARAGACFREAEPLRDRGLRRALAVGSEKKRILQARNSLGDLYKVLTFHFSLEDPSVEDTRFAAQMLIRRKGRVLDAVTHTVTVLRGHTGPREQIAWNRLQRLREEIAELYAPSLFTHQAPKALRRIRELQAEEERLEAELSHQSALHSTSLQEVELDRTQAAIPENACLVEYVRYPVFDPVRTGANSSWKAARYAALVLRSTGEPDWFDLGEADAIDADADELRRLLQDRVSTDAEREEATSAVRRRVLDPLAQLLDGAGHVLISPDGALTLLPFEVLMEATRASAPKRVTVSYLAAARDVVRAGTPAERTRAGGEIALFAAPDFDAEIADAPLPAANPNTFTNCGEMGPLPGTQIEAEEVAKLFDDAMLRLGADASVDALRRVVRPRVLHIATHGLFAALPDGDPMWNHELMPLGDELLFVQKASAAPAVNAMFCSALAFSGANRRRGEGRGGMITAQEMTGLDLTGTELVVLSACDTGVGTIRQGEEFTGLRRALAIAGAATQITSLWKVSDNATCQLMVNYYRALLDGAGRAEALQCAQETVRNDGDHPEWAHPKYWAAFVSSGAWGPLATVAPGEGNGT